MPCCEIVSEFLRRSFSSQSLITENSPLSDITFHARPGGKLLCSAICFLDMKMCGTQNFMEKGRICGVRVSATMSCYIICPLLLPCSSGRDVHQPSLYFLNQLRTCKVPLTPRSFVACRVSLCFPAKQRLC